MHRSLSIFLISDEARGVLVQYEPHETPSKYKFVKTLDPNIAVGDFVVVETGTRHEMTVVKVMEVDVEPNMDQTDHVNWIVSRIDWKAFEELKAQETAACDKIASAEKRRRRNQLAKDLEDDIGKEEFKALSFSGQK